MEQGLHADERLDLELLHRGKRHRHGLYFSRSFDAISGVNLVGRAHHVADTRRRAQHKKHNQEDRSGVKSEMAESQSSPHPSPPPTTSAATSSVAKRPAIPNWFGGGALGPAALPALDVLQPLAQFAQPVGVRRRHDRLPNAEKQSETGPSQLAKARGP